MPGSEETLLIDPEYMQSYSSGLVWGSLFVITIAIVIIIILRVGYRLARTRSRLRDIRWFAGAVVLGIGGGLIGWVFVDWIQPRLDREMYLIDQIGHRHFSSRSVTAQDIQWLIKNMSNPRSDVAERAIVVLGMLGSQASDAVPDLILRIDDSPETIRSLTSIGDPRAQAPLIERFCSRSDSDLAVAEALGILFAKVTSASYLSIQNSLIRCKSGHPDLEDIERIGSLQDKNLAGLLVKNLTPDFKGDPRVLLETLVKCARVDLVLEALDQDKVSVRDIEPQLLAPFGESIMELLVTLYDSGQSDRQKLAITTAGMIGGPKAIGLLIRAMRNKFSSIRIDAAKELARMQTVPVDPLDRCFYYGILRDQTALIAMGEQAVDPVVELYLSNYDKDDIRQGIEYLRQLNCPKATEAIGKLLRTNPVTEIRIACIEALAKLDGPTIVPYLLEAMKEKSSFASLWEDEKAALEVLVDIAKTSHDFSLVSRLTDIPRFPRIRDAAMENLCRLDPDAAAKIFLERLSRSNSSQAFDLVGALGKVQPKDPELRQRIIDALSPFLEVPLPQTAIFNAAVRSLGYTRNPKAVPLLLKHLQNIHGFGYVNQVVVEALGEIGHPGAAGDLTDLLEGVIYTSRRVNANDTRTIREESVVTLIEAIEKIGDPGAIHVLNFFVSNQFEIKQVVDVNEEVLKGTVKPGVVTTWYYYTEVDSVKARTAAKKALETLRAKQSLAPASSSAR